METEYSFLMLHLVTEMFASAREIPGGSAIYRLIYPLSPWTEDYVYIIMYIP